MIKCHISIVIVNVRSVHRQLQASTQVSSLTKLQSSVLQCAIFLAVVYQDVTGQRDNGEMSTCSLMCWLLCVCVYAILRLTNGILLPTSDGCAVLYLAFTSV